MCMPVCGVMANQKEEKEGNQGLYREWTNISSHKPQIIETRQKQRPGADFNSRYMYHCNVSSNLVVIGRL